MNENFGKLKYKFQGGIHSGDFAGKENSFIV